jgi:hypothetical protein
MNPQEIEKHVRAYWAALDEHRGMKAARVLRLDDLNNNVALLRQQFNRICPEGYEAMLDAHKYLRRVYDERNYLGKQGPSQSWALYLDQHHLDTTLAMLSVRRAAGIETSKTVSPPSSELKPTMGLHREWKVKTLDGGDVRPRNKTIVNRFGPRGDLVVKV